AAIIVLLLIPPAHAWAGKAINLPERHTAISPISATTWLPSGTIFGAPLHAGCHHLFASVARCSSLGMTSSF
ncbi:MAG TPA: hypothetical protein VNM92_09800, partial [Thermoanaerobaculia bacterium]|nr:hypothetical protein [Thermoanaerobaculia bacterium]